MYEVSSRHIEEQPTLVMTTKLKADQIKDWIGQAYSRTAELVGRAGLDFAGPPFARYRPLDDQYSEFEIEAGFPIEGHTQGEGDIVASTLPGGAVAVVTHIGPYDQMKPAYVALMGWIDEHGARPEGAAWEVYYSDPVAEPDPTTWRTEIYQPYKAL
jgi:effector-binding domain-containing protein